MSALSLLFAAALISFSIRNLFFLKLFAVAALIAAGILAAGHYPILLGGFAASSGIELFELLVFIVLGAVVLSEDEPITVTQSLFIGAASVLLLESTSLLNFVFSFEALSIISFVLVSHIRSAEHAEGAVKMFIAGAIATGLIVLGLALFTLEGNRFDEPLYASVGIFGMIGLWLMLMGLFYKLTIVPMHSWAADSYALIRPSHAAILSGVAKTVAAVATFKIFAPFLLDYAVFSIPVLVVLSVITMTLGNFLALFQQKIGKILAYSSIAHAGYMLLAFVAIQSAYASAGLLYLAVAYIFMQTAVFLLLDKLASGSSDVTLEDIKGLGQRDRLSAFFFTVQLFSLAGIPLLAGFLGKAVAVYAVVDAGLWPVALIALLNSALSVGYYAWIVKHLYFDAASDGKILSGVRMMPLIGQLILFAGTFYFGIFAFDIFSVSI